MLNNNNRTCRLKLRRGDVADILIMVASHYDAGEKWRILHDEIKRQFDEQEAKRDGVVDPFPGSVSKREKRSNTGGKAWKLKK